MPIFIWYAIAPNHWIRCVEMHQTITGISVTLYGDDRRVINDLHRRQIDGATIVQ
jgi:hypothetical protein